ncbi:tyrosyl-tRNA synthetase mitochondrial precursor [Lepidopterella palustris CBS 459.81]|uniref:Tyrosine--tRNA ligase n=1 Tax=Lepidopterella palustris CBS 459.81 TaxID=1314670 RepID=A0A8E2JKB6_9PEZI|nr:tyrosyl-tRNA synthetase mitochondrial precursor [Lepidopterella palustris CBS 459.81]
MAATSFFTRLARPSPYVCKQCLRNRSIARETRRAISNGWLQKTYEAELAWKDQALKIKAGEKQSMMTILEERGYIKDIAGGRDALDSLMIEKRIGAYVGIDPTAPSLHVGHLLPLMALYWMYVSGFHAVTLLGGATAKVGDPTGRTTSRDSVHSAAQKANMVSMHMQIKKLWVNVEALALKHGYKKEWAWKRALLNNNAWLNTLTLPELMRDLGSGVRLGAMLSRDTVKTRLQSGDGMSFAEFCYPLLQAWDWWMMYHRNGIQLQIGGSDQYGNICAGIDAVNHIRKTHHDPAVRQEKDEPLMQPYGITTPLLTTPSGEKFGKSAGNAVWLDPEMLSSFKLYQFFLRTSDEIVERYLKLFTFVPLHHIDLVMNKHALDPSKRIAQHLLAKELVELAHGAAAAGRAESENKELFSKGTTQIERSAIRQEIAKSMSEVKNSPRSDISPSLNPKAPAVTAQNAPSKNVILPRSLINEGAFPRILYAAGLVSSRSEGHRLVSNQGAYVAAEPAQSREMGDQLSWTPIKNFHAQSPPTFVIDGSLLVLRVGKWNIRMCQIVDDEEFEAQGLSCPGWDEFKAQKAAREEIEKEDGRNPFA